MEGAIKSRADARAHGDRYYFTGKPCKHGHVDKRYVSDKRCRTCKNEGVKVWARTHLPARRAIQRTYRQKHPDLVAKRARQYRATNLETCKAAVASWFRKNRHKARLYASVRRAKKRAAMPSWVDKNAIDVIYKACPVGMVVDHEVPLIHPLVCGLHVPSNLQYLSVSDNASKSNRFIVKESN